MIAVMVERDLSRHSLVRAVAQALRGPCAVPEEAGIVVAVSGGCDSVALLRALHVLAPRRTFRLRLVVGHVQHHLREEAEGEAVFVQELAGQLDLPFLRRDIQPACEQGNVEATARRLRYAALAQIAAESQCQFIATAHHGDDQLETLLMRLLRGTSIRGMRGIAWQRALGPQMARVIRPMLGSNRGYAADLLEHMNQPWREDPSNADLTRTRAQLRRHVLPVLRGLRPDAAAKAQQFAAHCQHAHRVIELKTAGLATLIRPSGSGYELPRDLARALDEASLLTLLHEMIRLAGVPDDANSARVLKPIAKAARDSDGVKRRFPSGPRHVVTVSARSVLITSVDS